MFKYKKQLAIGISAGALCAAGLTGCAAPTQSSSNSSSAPSAESASTNANTTNASASSDVNSNANTNANVNANANANANTASQPVAAAPKVDVSSWQWLPATLDCYNYTSKTGPCHVDYQWPNGFRVLESNDSGEQIRTYWFNPDPSKQTQDDADYYLSLMFMQGGYGPTQSSLEPDIEGGFQTRQIGGRDVLFGKMKATTKPDGSAYTGYTYSYYIPYDDEGWARVWILLTDQEENGQFRQTFENSLKF